MNTENQVCNPAGFLVIPKILLKDSKYKNISVYAKLLYAMMAERMSLSEKNGWVDDENKVYIFFTLDEAMEVLAVGKDKAIKVFAELDDVTGCGLISKIKTGGHTPSRIYVKILEVCKTEVATSEKPKSRLLKNRSCNFGKTDSSNNNINNTEINKTDLIISYPLYHKETIDYNSDRDLAEKKIKEDIRCDVLKEKFEESEIGLVVDIMVDCYTTKKEYIKIKGDDIKTSEVKKRLLKLDHTHIEYVLDCFHKTSSYVGNIKQYLLSCLFDAYFTMEAYYKKLVEYDLAQGG